MEFHPLCVIPSYHQTNPSLLSSHGQKNDLEDSRPTKRRKLQQAPSTLCSLTEYLSPVSTPSDRAQGNGSYSSTLSSRTTTHADSQSSFDDRDSSNDSLYPSASTDSSSVTSFMDELSPDDTSSEEDNSDAQVNAKKRKRVTKHQSRRAKPLTVEILHQIFGTLSIFRELTGTYKLNLAALKSADCSSKYFAVTEWQCFRKRIMNHGFEIIDEQPLAWIKVRPNLQTHDGQLIFESSELRARYSTPCKIKAARDHGEIVEVKSRDCIDLGGKCTPDSLSPLKTPDSPTAFTPLPPTDSSPVADASTAGFPTEMEICEVKQENVLPTEQDVETLLRGCLSRAARDLLSNGHFTASIGNIDILLSLRSSTHTGNESNREVCH